MVHGRSGALSVQCVRGNVQAVKVNVFVTFRRLPGNKKLPGALGLLSGLTSDERATY